MNKNNFQRVCIVDTVYTLLLYLVYSTEKEINATFFFFGKGIHKTIQKELANYYFFQGNKKVNKFLYIIYMIIFVWIGKKIRWPFLKKAKIFCLDHVYFTPYIIGSKSYTLLEDGPYSFKLTKLFLDNLLRNKNSLSRKIYNFKEQLLSIFVSKIFGHYLGNNELCQEIIITENEIVPYLKGKKINVISLVSLWNNSPASKKKLIMDVFGIKDEDIELIKSKENILFTQPFVEDGFISQEEQCRIYRTILDKYDQNSILIKTHPRDTLNYKSIFPNIPVFDKVVPMQLFDLLGLQFKKAITVSSSVVTSFNYDISVDWYGNEISESLVKKTGIWKYPDLHNKLSRYS
jgi:hypothetical protein